MGAFVGTTGTVTVHGNVDVSGADITQTVLSFSRKPPLSLRATETDKGAHALSDLHGLSLSFIAGIFMSH